MNSCLHGALSHSGSVVVLPSDNLYANATLPYNTRIVVGPHAVVYKIAEVVQCCERYGHPAVPRSGGHSYGAYSLGGTVNNEASRPQTDSKRAVVIDMRGIRHATYEPRDEVLRVGSGAMLGELMEALHANGRMMPTGSCPTVGVGGQALAGGYGLSSRMYGLLLDQLVSIDAVLADGTFVHASADSHPDLFWALRGGGSSFAIAYMFTFRTLPEPPTVHYFEYTLLPRALLPSADTAERATRLFAALQEFGAAPEAVPELGIAWHVTPEPLDGNLSSRGRWGVKVELLGQYTGDRAGFERAMRALNGMLEKHQVGEVQRGDRQLTFMQSAKQVGDWGRLGERSKWNVHEHEHFYVKSYVTLKDIPRDVVRRHVEDLLAMADLNPTTGVEWFVLGPYLGHAAIRRMDNGAFAHRDIKMMFEFYAKRRAGSDAAVDTMDVVKRMVRSLEPPEATCECLHHAPTLAVSHDPRPPESATHDIGASSFVDPAYVDPELGPDEWPRLMYASAYPRLQAIKAVYDPRDVFRQPQSIRLPSSRAGLGRSLGIRSLSVAMSDGHSHTYMYTLVGLVLAAAVSYMIYKVGLRRRARRAKWRLE